MTFEEWEKENSFVNFEDVEESPWPEDEGLLIEEVKVDDEFSYSWTPSKKKTGWRKSSRLEYFCFRGMREAFANDTNLPTRVVQHFEDLQVRGDGTIYKNEEPSTYEIKFNPSTLKTMYFDLEWTRMDSLKPSGLQVSFRDKVDYFVFALPSMRYCEQVLYKAELRKADKKYVPEKFSPYLKRYADKFYFCKTVDLMELVQDVRKRTDPYQEILAKVSRDKKNPSVCYQIPIHHKIWKVLPLNWDEHWREREPDFFQDIFA